MLEGLRKPTELIVIVVTRLPYGCPIQAIVHAFGLDERTVESPARSSRKALPYRCIKLSCHKDSWMPNTSKWMRFA